MICYLSVLVTGVYSKVLSLQYCGSTQKWIAWAKILDFNTVKGNGLLWVFLWGFFKEKISWLL